MFSFTYSHNPCSSKYALFDSAHFLFSSSQYLTNSSKDFRHFLSLHMSQCIDNLLIEFSKQIAPFISANKKDASFNPLKQYAFHCYCLYRQVVINTLPFKFLYQKLTSGCALNHIKKSRKPLNLRDFAWSTRNGNRTPWVRLRIPKWTRGESNPCKYSYNN